MSNVDLLRKQHHHLEALSANQEAPVQSRGEGEWAVGTCPSEGGLLCFGAFYKSHGKRDTLDRK